MAKDRTCPTSLNEIAPGSEEEPEEEVSQPIDPSTSLHRTTEAVWMKIVTPLKKVRPRACSLQGSRQFALSVSCFQCFLWSTGQTETLKLKGIQMQSHQGRLAAQQPVCFCLHGRGRGQPKDIVVRGVQIEDGNVLSWVSNQETIA